MNTKTEMNKARKYIEVNLNDGYSSIGEDQKAVILRGGGLVYLDWTRIDCNSDERRATHSISLARLRLLYIYGTTNHKLNIE